MTLEEYLEDEKVLMGLEIRREDIMDILEEFGVDYFIILETNKELLNISSERDFFKIIII